MNTPIWDFVRNYADSDPIRLHMPGHKGQKGLGIELWDITEIRGADALFEADGIIAESEAHATSLFGTARTVYSTEGSSLGVRAMIYLAVTQKVWPGRPWILAARNVHKSFIHGLALCDADVQWLWPQGDSSLCACPVTAAQVEQALQEAETLPAAVYLTSPDYLGGLAPIGEIAAVAHRYGVPLLVDNAHGAYLHFLDEPCHPMDLGADLCCDSAHKTLPVLTGGAYLHAATEQWGLRLKEALAVFASTSPSYLILQSLDRCNAYLDGNIRQDLRRTMADICGCKAKLRQNGWPVLPSEPMKITLRATATQSGEDLAQLLWEKGITCEFADGEHLVLMPSTATTLPELDALVAALGQNHAPSITPVPLPISGNHRVMTIRQAVFSPQEIIPTAQALGRVCAVPTVGCPPAIPIAVSGERISQAEIEGFNRYGICSIAVVK